MRNAVNLNGMIKLRSLGALFTFVISEGTFVWFRDLCSLGKFKELWLILGHSFVYMYCYVSVSSSINCAICLSRYVVIPDGEADRVSALLHFLFILSVICLPSEACGKLPSRRERAR